MADTGCKKQHGGLKTQDNGLDHGQRTEDRPRTEHRGWMIKTFIDTTL